MSALFDAKDSAQDRFSHARIDELIQNQLVADKGAAYAKSLYLNLSTLSPYVSGPNSVKVATPLKNLEAQDSLPRFVYKFTRVRFSCCCQGIQRCGSGWLCPQSRRGCGIIHRDSFITGTRNR